ncbi:MAG: heat-inducible transcription repressor HrcA [Candidatus Poribacteria bacterium]|nr:MAG: heat-inducible transcription repressor HrcA [Candidatus Poribacteria bacterium]
MPQAPILPLTERQERILQLIVEHYILTGEPVGSKTLVSEYSLPVSSATVRNEMAELEEIGLLNQPHRSAGRVPTEQAYRIYTERLLRERVEHPQSWWQRLPVEVRRRLIEEYRNLTPDEWEELFVSTCHILAQLSDYLAVVVAAEQRDTVLERLDLVPLNRTQVLAVLILRPGVVKQRIVRLDAPLETSRVEAVARLLNQRFAGKTLEEIYRTVQEVRTLWEMFEGEEREAAISIARRTFSERFDWEVYWEGARNLIAVEEMSDATTAAAFFETLESPETLVEAVGVPQLVTSRSGELHVLIGTEIPDERLAHCSVITATYSLGGGWYGVVGVLGPMRMRYLNVIPLVELTAVLLTHFPELHDTAQALTAPSTLRSG